LLPSGWVFADFLTCVEKSSRIRVGEFEVPVVRKNTHVLSTVPHELREPKITDGIIVVLADFHKNLLLVERR
jgi:hypothetical protein